MLNGIDRLGGMVVQVADHIISKSCHLLRFHLIHETLREGVELHYLILKADRPVGTLPQEGVQPLPAFDLFTRGLVDFSAKLGETRLIDNLALD